MARAAVRSGKRLRREPEQLIRLILCDDVLRFFEREPSGRALEPEGVHQLRTSTRRLRSDLQFLKSWFDAEWLKERRGELKWFGQLLGDVRDYDVLEDRMREACQAVGRSEADADLVLRHVQPRRNEARAALTELFESERYPALRAALIETARDPHWAEAKRPDGRALLKSLKRLDRSIQKATAELDPDGPPEPLHELRKDAKRARYAAEAFLTAMGPNAPKRAAPMAKRCKRIQDVLGRFQDAVVALGVLDELLAESSEDGADRSTLLALREREAVELQTARDDFRSLHEHVLDQH